MGMLVEFFALVSAAVGIAGLIIGLNRLAGRRLPKWLLPAGIATAMIGYAVWSEYSWFGRTRANLPETAVVAAANTTSAPWRPWTYLYPMTDMFVAIDRATELRHPGAPDQVMLGVYVYRRWSPTAGARILFDCATKRRANLNADAVFAEDGTVAGADWQELPSEDPVLKVACAGG